MPSSACSLVLLHRHSFPTRRSSDLPFGRAFVERLPGHRAHGGATRLVGDSRRTLKCDDAGGAGAQARRGLGGSAEQAAATGLVPRQDRKSTRLNSSHANSSYAVFCLFSRPPTSSLFPYTTLFRSTFWSCLRRTSSRPSCTRRRNSTRRR